MNPIIKSAVKKLVSRAIIARQHEMASLNYNIVQSAYWRGCKETLLSLAKGVVATFKEQ